MPWSTPRPYHEMRRLAEALAKRYVTFDPKPTQNEREGLITPPGAWHRRGGHRQLTTTMEHAQWVCDNPNGPDVWDALHDALAPELELLELPDAGAADVDAATVRPQRADWATDEHGQHWLPRPDGPLPRLSPRLEEIAATGQYDARQYDSPSEARQAVIAGAAACGWQLGHVAEHMRAGRWPGLVSFYARYRSDQQRAKALRADWENAVIWLLERSFGRESHIRGLDETTVARTLRMLRDEPDPFIDWVAAHRGERADTYRLIVPEAYAEAATWRRWAPGKLGGIHPVFRKLGGSAAFVYEALNTEPVRTFDLPGRTGLGATAVSEGLRALGEHGMAVRTRDGWLRGPADPGAVADQLGVPDLIAKIMKRYRKEREDYREWLGIVAELGPRFDGDAEDWSLPDEVYETLGMPRWTILEPHGPP